MKHKTDYAFTIVMMFFACSEGRVAEALKVFSTAPDSRRVWSVWLICTRSYVQKHAFINKTK
jgi:hypothetical protein